MDVTAIIFLTSGLVLGWSLGANDGANVFGTAVGSRMLRFGTATAIGAIFVVLGAVVSGAGATEGLTELGAVNKLAGAFTVALAAAVTVAGMSRIGMPVSTTQAIVGGIVGWNFFSGERTDVATLLTIVSTWVAGPVLGAIFAIVLYRLTALVTRVVRLHLLWVDHLTRLGLVLAGALGAYSLGANNVANVMGVFAPTTPLPTVTVAGVTIPALQQLFLLGGLAMAVGLFYSRRVMLTVGRGLMPVNPIGAWVVVVAHSLVLLMFSSRQLESWLLAAGLPGIPLVPVSSTQAVVGAVIGVGLARGFKSARQIRVRLLAGIAIGWVVTPLIAALLCFFMLFFMQNVFGQDVHQAAPTSASF
ncbi:MAG: inorganic phosphate transporter [Phycisphaerales bacterium]|nr:inorganic phosphate transporter [Phycisphaerae bacterium]NNF44558.1 inorganic phosphate transporter [Phycisphaerales bacterium]NNM26538.1 inorganic phosphate transporter [Phycisphaerales bacterium]